MTATLTHSEAARTGQLASPAAAAGRAQRISAHRVADVMRQQGVHDALQLIRGNARPGDVYQFICTLSATVRRVDRSLADLLDEFADEIDPTPAYGDDRGEA